MGVKPLMGLVAILVISIAIIGSVAAAITIRFSSDQGNYTSVKVIAIYDDREELVNSHHKFKVQEVPEDDAIEGVAVLKCPGETNIWIHISIAPEMYNKHQACGIPTPYATAKSYTVILSEGEIDAKAEVWVP